MSRLGRNRNTTEDANSNTIALNNTTSTKIADANVNRIFLRVDNTSVGITIYIKLQKTSTDDVVEGIIVLGGKFWEMPSDNIYTGEISGIASANSPEITVTEY